MYVETEEQGMLREAVRKLARSYGHSYWLERARGDANNDDLWLELGKNGYLGVNQPLEYGGGGGGIAELAIVCEELAAAGTPSFMLIVSNSICGEIILRHGTQAQRERWLPRLCDGTTKLCFSITEPGAGLNTHNISTNARRDGDSWVINGLKYFASGVEQSEAIIVVARTGTNEETGRGDLSLFLVPSDAPGLTKDLIPVEVTAPEKQFTLTFNDVIVPADALIGEVDQGLHQVFAGLNPERIMAAAFETGIGLYALEKASAYANEREVWGVPIGSHQGIAHMLAKSKIEVELARLMTQKAAWLHDNDLPAGEAANIAKYAAAEACLGALDNAIQTHGGNGFATEYGLATLWWAARLQRTTPVSREMIFNFVAQHSLGLPRSY
jgi:alkylation response protein AidB-like acyl-CoA dehydrogenase